MRASFRGLKAKGNARRGYRGAELFGVGEGKVNQTFGVRDAQTRPPAGKERAA
jgi:hypothetical protein